MLFEQESLPPKGRIAVLSRLFCEVARRTDGEPAPGHVPVPVLEALRDFETHVRYMIEAAEKLCTDKERLRILRKSRHVLDSLPEQIMQTLCAGPDENWLRLYRGLVQLHDLMEQATPAMEAEEYTAIVQKMVALAGAVADSASVKVDGSSMFALMLMQVLIQKYTPRRRKRSTKKRKKRIKK